MKKLIISLKLLFCISILLFSLAVLAGESFIPLESGARIANDDLLNGDLVMSSREADSLRSLNNVDLSRLNPVANEIWSNQESFLDDQKVIELESSDTTLFAGSLTSNSGLYRFNITSLSNSKIYTIHLDKTLHSLLLRKNLLRKLGYKIPAIKYLKKIIVQFNSLEEREQFLKKEIPENTFGAAERWVKKINELSVELQDVAITEPSENDFYNVALGIPTQTINSRTLRSLIIPYSLVDLYESVNKFSWVDGKIDNRALVLSHFTGNEFSTTVEDALWMLRKINLLSRSEITQIVSNSYFPNEIALVLIEKLIARRNSLNKLLNEKTQLLEFDTKISLGDSLKEGRVLQKDFSGYASRFAFGDAESPLEQLNYYLFSKIQSNVIDNLVSKFNTYLEKYDLQKTRTDFFKKQFQDGLDHFIQTGELRPIGISTWSSPVFNGQFIFSRDIILGNYLGTDNLVQLADTFGASADLGVYVGVEGLGNNLSPSVKATTSLVRTFSHIKPVKNLKQSLKEPYKNMFVKLLKNSLREKYFTLSELKNSTDASDAKALKVQNLLKEIALSLDTGESLIMTDRIMPTAELKLNFSNGMIGAGVGAGMNVTTIKRIQIFKKSSKILQIYDDAGFVKDINVSFQLNNYIPLIKISGKRDVGIYHLNSYMVNLSSDLDENPNFFMNSLGVYNVLKDNNFEVLNSVNGPVKLAANFKDRRISSSMLLWKMKSIKGKTYFNVETKDGLNGKYFSLNKDFSNGLNVEAFSKQIANYYLSDLSKGVVSLTVENDANPGESFFGKSTTQNIRFESEVGLDNKFQRKFLSVADTKQGWAISAKNLKDMMASINEKFQSIMFDINQIDFDKLRLFKVGYHINIYDRGLENLNSLKLYEIERMETRYRAERGCTDPELPNYSSFYCGDLRVIKQDLKKCQNSQNDEDLASCDVDLIEDLLIELEFKDLKKILGENNFYIYGTIDGFRQHSEILNDTIFSNTLGKIGTKEWNGTLESVRDLLGLSGGEFFGSWLRESI